jgi:hypothetical protein
MKITIAKILLLMITYVVSVYMIHQCIIVLMITTIPEYVLVLIGATLYLLFGVAATTYEIYTIRRHKVMQLRFHHKA